MNTRIVNPTHFECLIPFRHFLYEKNYITYTFLTCENFPAIFSPVFPETFHVGSSYSVFFYIKCICMKHYISLTVSKYEIDISIRSMQKFLFVLFFKCRFLKSTRCVADTPLFYRLTPIRDVIICNFSIFAVNKNGFSRFEHFLNFWIFVTIRFF